MKACKLSPLSGAGERLASGPAVLPEAGALWVLLGDVVAWPAWIWSGAVVEELPQQLAAGLTVLPEAGAPWVWLGDVVA